MNKQELIESLERLDRNENEVRRNRLDYCKIVHELTLDLIQQIDDQFKSESIALHAILNLLAIVDPILK